MARTRNITLYDTLGGKELSALNQINTYINNDMPSTTQKVIDKFKMISNELIVQFANQSSTVLDFCKNNLEMKKHWQEKLSKANYPAFEIYALDNSKMVSEFELFMAATYLQAAFDRTQSQKDVMLARACDLGLYKALAYRCEANQQEMLRNPSKQQTYLEVIERDCATMSNLYSAYGLAQAGKIFLNVAAKQMLGEEKVRELQEKACRAYLSAYLLSEQDSAVTITAAMTNGSQLASQLGAFENWQDMHTFFQKLLGEDSYQKIYTLAEQATNPTLKQEAEHASLLDLHYDTEDEEEEVEQDIIFHSDRNALFPASQEDKTPSQTQTPIPNPNVKNK